MSLPQTIPLVLNLRSSHREVAPHKDISLPPQCRTDQLCVQPMCSFYVKVCQAVARTEPLRSPDPSKASLKVRSNMRNDLAMKVTSFFVELRTRLGAILLCNNNIIRPLDSTTTAIHPCTFTSTGFLLCWLCRLRPARTRRHPCGSHTTVCS